MRTYTLKHNDGKNNIKGKYKLCVDGLIVDRNTGVTKGFVFNDDERDKLLNTPLRSQHPLLTKYLYEVSKGS